MIKMNWADDDFFSPVRHITSDSDSSIDFENSDVIPSSVKTFTNTHKEKRVSKHNKTKYNKERNELGSCSSESSFPSKFEDLNICPPLTNKDSNKSKRDSKAQTLDFNKVKSEKEKYLKDNIKSESISKSSECHSKKQEHQESKDTADYDAIKSNSKQNYVKKSSSRPTSLSLSRKEISKGSSSKDLKKEKNVSECSKNIYKSDVLVSDVKHTERKVTDKSLDARGKKFEVYGEKSVDSNSCKSLIYGSSNTKCDTSNKKPSMNQSVENPKSTSNIPVNTPFEISVEKIVHNLISSECDKIRQNMYAQQMTFYRELNKVKEEMKRQHLADTDHMLKIIHELAQMNSSLKSMS